jgi:hypothetical protein
MVRTKRVGVSGQKFLLGLRSMVFVVAELDRAFAIRLEHFGRGEKTVTIPISAIIGIHIGGVSGRIFT